MAEKKEQPEDGDTITTPRTDLRDPAPEDNPPPVAEPVEGQDGPAPVEGGN